MPNVVRTVRSGDQNIDGLLTDFRWATNALTFSFPTRLSHWSDGYGPGEEPYDNFEPLNAVQRAAVVDMLGAISKVANLGFSQSSGGSGDLRFGMSDLPETAHAYTPTSAPWGGDSWYNNSGGEYDRPVRGGYAYHTFLHEIGHALGLKHPHETEVFGRMTEARDWLAYTVMSYRSFRGASTGDDGGYTNETWGYPQSLMLYDIAAFQHMYGARFASESDHTTYSWSASTGEMSIDGVGQGAPGGNRIFLTVWDGGGIDSYDFSGYATGLRVDLRPGEWTFTSTTQLANLGFGRNPPGNIANAFLYKGDTRSLIENAVGGTGNDELIGNQTGNQLTGGAGADELHGLNGADRLDGGRSSDWMYGGFGSDTYVVDDVEDVTVEALDRSGGSDRVLSSVTFTLRSDVEHLTLTGQRNIDAVGNEAANRLRGNRGDNLLDGRAGADVMSGGAGDDGYVVDNAGDRIVEAHDGGIEWVRSHIDLRLTAGLENLILAGAAVTGIGNSRANLIIGNDAANLLNGGEGVDRMSGHAGDDTYVVDDSRDAVIERGVFGGSDLVRSRADFQLGANLENLTLVGPDAGRATGNALDNLISGTGRANILNGFGGADRMRGGGGRDTYFVDNAGDRAIETSAGDGIDRVYSAVGFALGQHLEDLALIGRERVDAAGTNLVNFLRGNAVANRVEGRGGDDLLVGRGGHDALIGGAGNDVLVGDSGRDSFYFHNRLTERNADLIRDFDPSDDTMLLRRTAFEGIGADDILSDDAFHVGRRAADAEDRVIFDDSTGRLFYDADGSGPAAARLFGTVDAGLNLSNLDFHIYG